jgi:cation:H+ antiporter
VLVSSLLALAGLALLTVAADHLVLGSSRIAARLRVAPVVVGVVVIGLGTSAPEFLVSGVAAARGDMGIAIGNIVGSNILNLTLILGVAALIGAVRVESSVIRREVRLSVVAVAAFAVIGVVGLSVWTGALLAGAATAALWLLVRWARRSRDSQVAAEAIEFTQTPAAIDVPAARPRSMAVETVRSVLGLAGVLAGAQLLVANASSIAERVGVPQLVIGFTLVALGTSLPELVTTVMAMRRGEDQLVVGNLFGSNLFNSLAGGAVIGLAGAGEPSARPAPALLGLMVVTSVAAWLMLRSRLRLTRVEAGILLGVYLLSLPIVLSGL